MKPRPLPVPSSIQLFLTWIGARPSLFTLAAALLASSTAAAASVPKVAPMMALAPVPIVDLPAAPIAPAILQELRGFRELGRVLYVAAHPDDENTQLITYLARGRHYRTAYLALTRGDGGQNLLGPEFGSTLGLARTEELLAARRIDGGQQFFTRALDFGFSKDVRETLTNWDRKAVVGDIVRVIRTFRPDVIITRFSPQPGGTHGHHTASAVLAIEAFKLAGDPKAYPEQLSTLTPWQPKRILQNGGFGGPGRGTPAATAATTPDLIQIESGGQDPVLGKSFSEIASDSRRMHKTQGYGNLPPRTGQQLENFLLLDGEPATKDIFDGIDSTWAKIPGAADIGPMTDAAIAAFNADDPSASVPALLTIRAKLAKLPAGVVVSDKRQQLDRALQDCLGLVVATTVPQAEIVAGETVRLTHAAVVKSNVPVKWAAVRYPSLEHALPETITLRPNETATRSSNQTLPDSTPVSQPYWLRQESVGGMFQVAATDLIGRPENPPVLPIAYDFEVGNQTLTVLGEPVQIIAGVSPATSHRRLEVIPPVSMRFVTAVKLFALSSTHPVEVELVAARAGAGGSLQLEVPTGWKVTPASRPFKLSAAGDRARLSFTLTAPAQATTARVSAFADVDGKRYNTERNEVNYGHIPILLLQPPARLKTVSLDLAIAGKKVGYLPGAGDSVADSITQMGYEVTILGGGDLTPMRLKEFDAVVVGVRAFNTRTDLGNLPGLFTYIENGGTVIEQYNRPGRELKTEKFAPYPLKLSDDRVTDERAAMTFLLPDHPALNRPNKITAADFNGWLQERGSYFPNQWDDHFEALLACNDVGDAPMKGSLLIASYGKGHIVYTGLSFFRQLPDGVPGAYRLFANLLSLGK